MWRYRCWQSAVTGDQFMPSPFFRSERFLESETLKRGAWGLLIAAVPPGLWVAWFFRARVAVYAVSETADLEVDRAAHPVESQYSSRLVCLDDSLAANSTGSKRPAEEM